MPIPVRLKDVVDELEILPQDATACINKKTGEIVAGSEEDWDAVEDTDSEIDDYPDWQKEIIEQLRVARESEDFIELPSKFDVHELQIMQDFCCALNFAPLREDLLDAIRGRGAFRRFHEMTRCHGLEEAWQDFRWKSLEQIAIHFLDEHKIPWTRE